MLTLEQAMQISPTPRNRRRASGFTLVELMVVLLIVSILVAVGYPSYGDYVVRSNRKAAASALYRLADRQEQFFLDNKSYADSLTTLGYGDDVIGLDRDGQFTGAAADDAIYTLTMTDPGSTSYQLEADPAGMQAERDGGCGTLTLDDTGNRGASGDDDNCW
jgi:type IV pilus assembly protein PilE